MILLASYSTEVEASGWGCVGRGQQRSNLSYELLEPEPSVLREANQLSPYVSCLIMRLPRGRLKVNWEAAAKKKHTQF